MLIRALLFEPSEELSHILGGCLHSVLGADVTYARDYATALEAAVDPYIDLLVVAAEHPGDDAASAAREISGLKKLIFDLRHGRIGSDPFLPIIVTSWHPDGDLVAGFNAAGADLILRKPISIAVASLHFESLLEERRPYIATADYVGPDRRHAPRATSLHDPTLFTPPNRLKILHDGHSLASANYFDLVRQLARHMAADRIRVNLVQAIDLVERIIAAAAASQPTSDADLARVEELLAPLPDILARADRADLQIAAEDLLAMIKADRAHSDRLLKIHAPDLVRAGLSGMLLALNPETNGSRLAAELDRALSSYRHQNRDRPAAS